MTNTAFARSILICAVSIAAFQPTITNGQESAKDAAAGKIIGCNASMEMHCPARDPQYTFSVPLSKQIIWTGLTCIPDNSRPGNSIINTIEKKCPGYACTPEVSTRVDGCSVPGILQPTRFQVQESFGAACVGHDICYNTARVGGGTSIEKSECDTLFRKNMHNICDEGFTKGLPGHFQCISNANLVYDAVSRLAQKSYDEDQKWGHTHCTQRR